MKKNDVFCAYPFVQLSTVPGGFVRPCCYFTDMLKNSEGRNYSVATDRLSTIWNSDELKKIRVDMLNGKRVSLCSQCYTEEKNGDSSMRLRSLKEWDQNPGLLQNVKDAETRSGEVSVQPKYLEIKPGNLCNLKCRMCNQFDSSSVAEEIRALSKKYEGLIAKDDPRLFDSAALEVDFSIDKMPNWSKIPQFWDDVAQILPTLEMLSFAGGEPTLIPEVQQLLQLCVDRGYAKNITVYLASNFTKLNQELIELSKHFKLFEFIASIDGTGAVQEYIRFQSRWPVVAENFARVKKHVRPQQTKLLVNLTLQMYNVLSFTEVFDWIETLAEEAPAFYQHPYAINVLYFPRYLYIDLLPTSVRPLAIERIRSYIGRSRLIPKLPGLRDRLDLVINQLNEPLPPDYAKRLQDFWNYTRMLDEHRKQSLKHIDPILYHAVQTEVQRLSLEELPLAPSSLSTASFSTDEKAALE